MKIIIMVQTFDLAAERGRLTDLKQYELGAEGVYQPSPQYIVIEHR